MTTRHIRSLVLALATFTVGLALAADAEAQMVTYYYRDPAPYFSSVHYHRVYQATSLHWNPVLGWHGHDHYTDVPRWVSNGCTDRGALYCPVVTYYPVSEVRRWRY
jgi:hypothetical protein